MSQFIVISVPSYYHEIHFTYLTSTNFVTLSALGLEGSLILYQHKQKQFMWENEGFLGKKKKSQANKFSSYCLSESMTISIKNMQCSLLWPLGRKCSSMQSTVGLKLILVSPYSFTFQSSFSKEAAVIIKNSKSQSLWHRIILTYASDSSISVAISTHVSDSFISVAFLLV